MYRQENDCVIKNCGPLDECWLEMYKLDLRDSGQQYGVKRVWRQMK